MDRTTTIDIHPPYLIFVGDTEDELFAKTGFGVVQWRPELCMGQYRSTRTAVDLGLRDVTPAEAVTGGANSMIVGVANVGGSFGKLRFNPLQVGG